MNRNELAVAIQDEMGIDAISVRKIEKVLASLPKVIALSLQQKDKVVINNLCTFRPVTRKARGSYDPRNMKKIQVPERESVRVIWSQNLLSRLNGGE